jgi:hypothetical protein
MASPGEDVYLWSATAASNNSADALINWAEGQLPGTVNDSARGMMAAIAKQRALRTGAKTTGGSANAQTLTSGVGYTALPNPFFAAVEGGLHEHGRNDAQRRLHRSGQRRQCRWCRHDRRRNQDR